MTALKQNKLNHLFEKYQNGLVITAKDLSRQGYSYSLLHQYCTNGWLKSIGQGAYLRVNDELHWSGALYTLQSLLNIPVHLGGFSALAIEGTLHYIPFKESLHLYNSIDNVLLLPGWFKKCFPEQQHYQHLLFDEPTLGLQKAVIRQLSINVSSLERAILEVIALVPHVFDYEHVYHLVESLMNLRPELLQKLLEACRSIKVKRLFLHLAHKTRLPCEKHLDLSRIELGKGKRVIGKGGQFDPLYQLSVPTLSSYEDLISDV